MWLDQEGGLVGGDAWDRKIREQIAACALFIPIVSANTQARREGYFRLEWKLAEDRSHLSSGYSRCDRVLFRRVIPQPGFASQAALPEDRDQSANPFVEKMWAEKFPVRG